MDISSDNNSLGANLLDHTTKCRTATSETAEKDNRIKCKFFFSIRGCAKGDTCKFSHEVVTEEKIVAASQTRVSEKHHKPACKFFAAGHCKWGNRCGFYHPASAAVGKQHEKQQRPLSQMEDYELKKCRQTEIGQLKRRFPRRKEGADGTFRFQFKCSDPDWVFDVKTINLKVFFPPFYPRECMSVAIDDPGEIPDTLARYISRKINHYITENHSENTRRDECYMMFRPFLRWLDRNADNLFTEGLSIYKRELVAKAAGLTFINTKQLASDKAAENLVEEKIKTELKLAAETEVSSCTEQDSHGIKKLALEFNAKAAEENAINTDGQETKSVNNDKLDPIRKGTEVKLRGLQLLESTATLYCSIIRIGLKCKRCKTVHHIKLHAEKCYVVICDKCRAKMTLIYHTSLMHSHSNTMGFFDLEGCTPFDLILPDCQAVAICLRCDKEISLHGLQSDSPKNFWCLSCHSKMAVVMEKGSFVLLNDRQELKAGTDAIFISKNPKVKSELRILEGGKPLPENGACRHYKKSYRWFRFPCCGKLYPCDLCHDEKELDHEQERANRMVCGFCSKEQVFSIEKPCVQCNSSMTRANSSHWEGGKGCRNKIAMAKTDKQKFSGINKTISSKAAEAQKKSGKKTTRLRHTS